MKRPRFTISGRLLGRWILRLCLIGVGGLGSILLFQFIVMPLVVRSGQETIVPDLRGLPLSEVLAILTEASLCTGQLDKMYDDHIPSGRVLLQNPPPDSPVKIGREVDLIISLGLEHALVPDLEGESIVHARFLLARNGLSVGRISRVQSRTIPRDHLVATSPPVGCPLSGRTEVDFLVSAGSPHEKYIMPDLIGHSSDEIEQTLTERGFVIQRGIWPGSDSRSTTIVEQTPPPGYPIELAGTIEIITGNYRVR